MLCPRLLLVGLALLRRKLVVGCRTRLARLGRGGCLLLSRSVLLGVKSRLYRLLSGCLLLGRLGLVGRRLIWRVSSLSELLFPTRIKKMCRSPLIVRRWLGIWLVIVSLGVSGLCRRPRALMVRLCRCRFTRLLGRVDYPFLLLRWQFLFGRILLLGL